MSSGSELQDYILPFLDCDAHRPVYQQHTQDQKTQTQEVSITGVIPGSTMPEGSILWLPERGFKSAYLMAPLKAGISAPQQNGTVATLTKDTQIFVGAQNKYLRFEPNLPTNFSIGRATHGQLHIYSSAQAVTSTILSGVVSAGNLPDYRDADFSNGAQLAQFSGQYSPDAVPQAYLSDGITLTQGPDLRRELGMISDKDGYVNDNNQIFRVQYPINGDPPTRYAGLQLPNGARIWLADATWSMSNMFSTISIATDVGPFPLITYELKYYVPYIFLSQPATAWTRLQVEATHFFTQWNPTDATKWCVYAIVENYNVDTQIGTEGGHLLTCTISPPNVFHAHNIPNMQAQFMSGTIYKGEGAVSTYMGTRLKHDYASVNSSIFVGNWGLVSVTARIRGQYKPGGLGPARVVSWTGASSQDISVVGKQYWQLIVSNSAAQYLAASKEKQETPEARRLLNWLYDGAPVPIFRRIYVRTQWLETVEKLRREGVANILTRLKVRAEQLEAIGATLRASATGLFADACGVRTVYVSEPPVAKKRNRS